MPIHLLSACWTPAASLLAWLLALPLPAPPKLVADDAPQPAKAHLVTQTYQVADLVIPRPAVVGVPVAPTCGASKGGTEEDRLIKLITTSIDPESWSAMGGAGTIDYHPLSMGLVIRQTPDVQEQVADLLESLRRLQDRQVSLEVRFVTLDETFMQRLGLDGEATTELKQAAACDSPLTVTFLNDAKVYRLLEAVQQNQRANVMQAPKITVFDGQTAVLDATEMRRFVTGINSPTLDNGQLHFQPPVEEVPVGIHMTVRPVVSEDPQFHPNGKGFVKVSLNASLTDVDSVMTELISVEQAGDDGEGQHLPPLPQCIQHPQITRLAVDSTFKVPDGGTALISGWKRDREVRTECATPILSEIPYLNRLFTNVGCHREKECILLMVTPRVIVPTEDEEKQTGFQAEPPCPRICTPVQYITPPACKSVEAAALVAKYHQACAEGHNAEATQFAVQALAIDPTCFHADGILVQPCYQLTPACVTSSPKK